MKLTKESVLKTFNSLTMPAWIKRVITLIIDYVDEAASSIDSKADLVGGKVPAEQLPSYVDDVIEFEYLINGTNAIDWYLNNTNFTNKTYFVLSNDPAAGSLAEKYNNTFIAFGANVSEEDWIIIDPEKGKIYVSIGNTSVQNHSYRWTGTTLVDLDKTWSDKITFLESKTLSVNLGTITDPLDLSVFTNTSKANVLYTYLNQRHKFQLINLLWVYNNVQYDSPIIDVDPVERSFRIYNQGYLQTYKVLKEGSNYSLVKVNDIPEFVSLDYSQTNVDLSDDLIERLKNAAGVVINDDQAYPNERNVYISSMKTDKYLIFIAIKNISLPEDYIAFRNLIVNLTTKQASFGSKRYTLPYGAYSKFGFTGKNADAVNQEVARLVNMNSYYITPSDLNKVYSGDKLENIKNATFLILDEGDGKTKIFIRGYESTAIIYYNCINNSGSMKYILLRLGSNILSSIENAYFDDIMFTNYRVKGGTKTNKDLMYKELIAQLTENTYVIDSSKLNTVLTNEEDTAILNATTIIVSNYPNNKPMVFIRGYDQTSQISFLNTSESINGSAIFNKLKYIKNSKTASITASVVDPYNWYAAHGGTIKDQSNFESINAFLYDRTYIIDKALLNSTITDTFIQDSIKRANILVVEDSTDSSYKVCIRGFVSTNSIYFFNLQNANADNITATRVQFNTTTNLLNSQDVYLQSAFNAYKLGGGTKYTTESAFNAQFAKVIDMTVTQ